MRITLVVEWLDPSRGGAETSTRQFIDRLAGLGVALDVVTRSQLTATESVRYHTVATKSGSRAGSTAEFMRKAQGVARDIDGDLVHALTPCVGAALYQPRGGLVAETILRTAATRRPGVRRGLKRWAMTLNRRQSLMLNAEQAWLSAAEKPIIIALSDYVVRQLRAHYDYPESRIRRVFNGVEMAVAGDARRLADREAVRSRHGISQGDFLLLAVCHNFRLKGVGRLIEALAAVRRRNIPNVRAVIVGRERPVRWRRMAERMGVAGLVTFAGPVDDVPPYLHAADVLVHPTYYDPCSRVVLEAVRSSLPVICTRFDGASEVLEDGVSGFVLDSPDDVDALADGIVRLSDGNVRKNMAAAAGRVSDRVTMERHVEEVYDLYRSMVRRPMVATSAGGR